MEAVDVQREKLLPFGANCVLLDLEWVREDICQNRNFPGDHFHPDLRRFPSGMKAIADGIKQAGFVPQLWYGVTNEAHITKEMEEHPEIVLTDEDLEYWPGCRFLDVTHPYVKENYLPRFFAQLKQWGFDALKWDLLTETEMILETYHDRLYDPSKSSSQIMRELGLEQGSYLLYDYCHDRLYEASEPYPVTVEPRHTALFAVHKRQGVPQVVSSSRHLLQGAVELEDAMWQSGTLSIRCRTVPDYPYQLTVFVPDGFVPEDCGLKLRERRDDFGGAVYTLTVPGSAEELFQTELLFS